ncbi:unnamed protein product, partial [Phaeothamnion confervicola]
IKSVDPFNHPIINNKNESQLNDFDLLTGLDNVQYHLYNTSLLSTQEAKDKSIMAQMTRVGLVNGEYGLDVTTADVPFDVQRVSIWTGIMSQVPHLMWKWDNYVNAVWANLFQYPAAFLASEDFVSKGELSDLEMTAAYNAEMLEAIGFKSDENLYGIVYDKIHRSNITGGIVDLSSAPAGNYTVTFTDILTGAQTEVTTDIYNELELPVFSKGIAFKARFNYEIILSTEDEQLTKNLKTYPNPTSNILYVDIKTTSSPVRVELISAIGTTSGSLTVINEEANSDRIRIELNKAGILPGIYFIRITTSESVLHGKVLYTTDQHNNQN